MTRFLSFTVIVLIGALGIACLEVRAVRDDQKRMKAIYDAFLGRKIKDKRLGDMIKPNSLAVFNSKSGYVACAVINDGR
jgi:hypothetical protein